jgi:hypothetical protein
MVWVGHEERKGDDDFMKRCTRMEVDGSMPKRRPRKTWIKMLDGDMKRCALSPVDVNGRGLWRVGIYGAKWPSRVNLDIPCVDML